MSQNGDLWFISIDFVVIAQWLIYLACKPQIMSSNPLGVFVLLTEVNFEKDDFFYFFAYLTYIHFIHHAIYYNQAVYC